MLARLEFCFGVRDGSADRGRDGGACRRADLRLYQSHRNGAGSDTRRRLTRGTWTCSNRTSPVATVVDMSALDRPVWSALTTGDRRFAEGGPLALRFPPDIAPFGGDGGCLARSIWSLEGAPFARGARRFGDAR